MGARLTALIEDLRKKRWAESLLPASGGIIFLALFYAAHFRSLFSPIVGEEGMFAFMLTHPFEPSEGLLIGSLNEVLQFTLPEHPVLMYWYVESIQGVQAALVGVFGITTAAFRLIHFIPVFIVALGIVLTFKFLPSSWKVKGQWLVVLAIVSASPLFGTPFLSLQTDTLFGSPVFALSGLSMLLALRNHQSRRWFVIFLCTSGALMGLGKQEWAISALAAGIVIFSMEALLKSARPTAGGKRDFLSSLQVVGPFALGIVFGSIVSLVADPKNYWGGFDVIRRTMFSSTNPIEERLASTWAFISMKTPFLLPVLVVFVVFCLLVVARGPSDQRRSLFSLFFLVAVGNVLPGYFSSWSADLRYVVPGGVAMLFTVMAGILLIGNDKVLLRISMVGFTTALFFSILFTSGAAEPYSKEIVQRSGDSTLIDCAILTSSANVFVDPHKFDWISEDLGREGALAHLKRYGGAVQSICPAD